MEDVAVEEEDGAEGLVLSGGGDVFFDGEVGDECLDFFRAHVFGVAVDFAAAQCGVVEEDVAGYPFSVGLFGAVGVMLCAHGVGDLVEEFFVFVGFWGIGHIDLGMGGCL